MTIPRPQLRELSAELCLKGGLPVKAQHLWWLTIPGRLQNLSIETANIWLEEERPILSLCNWFCILIFKNTLATLHPMSIHRLPFFSAMQLSVSPPSLHVDTWQLRQVEMRCWEGLCPLRQKRGQGSSAQSTSNCWVDRASSSGYWDAEARSLHFIPIFLVSRMATVALILIDAHAAMPFISILRRTPVGTSTNRLTNLQTLVSIILLHEHNWCGYHPHDIKWEFQNYR